jgi:hypothetical protein
MNKIDNFYTENIENFSKSYFSYLKEIFDKVRLSEIKSFIEVLLTARESGSTIFLLAMVVVRQQQATLLMIWHLVQMSMKNHSK